MTSAANSDIFVDVYASIEPTLAGDDFDAISGPVMLHLMICALVLNQL